MYMTPGSGGGSPHHAPAISDAPIARFSELIEETPVSEWQKRTSALQRLVDTIPEGSAYCDGLAWYNSPPTLRRLAQPLAELLKDARSTVVKRTCAAMSQLFTRCQSEARYLFKDLMPVVLSVHAQTVQVIRQAVQNMVLEAINEVPCKMVMPLWMERLKIDKSRTVRDACSIYLGQALQCWTEDGYLTEEIWLQVGKTLISTLRDPSPSVRGNSKAALERIRRQEGAIWDRLVHDPDGPAARDRKLQQWLKTLGAGSPDAEELSVASRFSYNSDIRIRTKSSFSPSNNASNNINNIRTRPSRVDEEYNTVPLSIAVAANGGSNMMHDRRPGSGLGPPLRRVAAPPAISTAAHQSPPRLSDKNAATAARNTQPPPATATASLSSYSNNSHAIPAVSESLSDLEQILTLKPAPPASSSPAAARKTAPPERATQFRYDGEDDDFNDDDNLKMKKHPISDLKDEPAKKEYAVSTSTTATQQRNEENHGTAAEMRNGTAEASTDNFMPIEEASSFPADLNLPALRQTFARMTNRSTSPKIVEESNNDNNSNSNKLTKATAVSEESIVSNLSGESKGSHNTNEMPSVSSTQAVITTDKDAAVIVKNSSSTTDFGSEEGPFVANMQELKKYSKRRTRSSLLIQERLRISSSMSMLLEEDEPKAATGAAPKTGEPSDEENTTPNPLAATSASGWGKPPVFPAPKQQPLLSSHREEATASDPSSGIIQPTPSSLQAPEHMVIAIRLLKAHKEHVDAIMETLRIEMETLRDFDQLLEEPGRPTEEEVLDYFESVGICLEQRTLAGSQLQREMDLVSRGEPPQD
jgi:hypothetical protein